MQKKHYLYLAGLVFIVALVIVLAVSFAHQSEKTIVENLPAPTATTGERGEMGIDQNINESTLDDYLGREDTVYRDMRMLDGAANFEKIGGEKQITGFVEDFEMVPYPKLFPVEGLAAEVGSDYTGKTLYKLTEGQPTPRYEESLSILEYYFPKDKNIFLMSGNGFYAGKTKDLLVKLGWNKDKIYVVGGYWYYDGKHKISIVNGDYFDNWKITYHDFDVNTLHRVSTQK